MTHPTRPSSQSQSQNNSLLLVVASCLAVFVCVAFVGVAVLAGFFIWDQVDSQPIANATIAASTLTVPDTTPLPSTPVSEGVGEREEKPRATVSVTPAATPTATAASATPTIGPPAQIEQAPVPARAVSDLDKLLDTDYPAHDYYDAAIRLGRRDVGERTVTVVPYQIGDRRTFTMEEGPVEARLVATTEHTYFWVEEGLNFDPGAVAAAAGRLEDEYYPRLVNLFGQEWQPGIDNDPRFSVLHLAGSGSASELGYFTNVDEYPRSLYRDSNEQEIVYLNMDNLEVGSDLYYGTLVHEVQHLIQWYVDANETAWLNEGLSQLAELYVGLDTASPTDYLRQPEIRLNAWNYDEEVIDAHYSAAYLYSVYIWEQLGEAAVQELSRHPANGMAAVRSILQGYQPERSLEQFTADWAAANYLDDPAAGPYYAYQKLDLARPAFANRVKTVPFESVEELNQYGTHYISLDFRDQATITFAGDTLATLIDDPPRVGQQMWFAPALDETSAQLTAAFDLSGLNEATFKFGAWYDLEADWDFAYLSISTDNGQSWQLLVPDHAQAGEHGPAFNGRSADAADAVDGWVKESISLNEYTGRPVLIRFEVLTDSAVVGRGFAVDDIAIPELGYQSDAEAGSDGWMANGFVQTGWQLPQQWAVQLIEGGPDPTVTSLPVNELNQGKWTVEIGKGGGVLVVTALTPFTDETGSYWLHIEE